MKALVFKRSPSKYIATKAISTLSSRYSAAASSLEFLNNFELEPPSPDFVPIEVALSGICGSDIGFLSATSSRYFEPLTSFPFVPGHEIVGTTTRFPGHMGERTRVVVEPLLGCVVRSISETCEFCASGQSENCTNITAGVLKPGVQTGYCASTGGGWSKELFVHPSQLHVVSETMSDIEALMVEPYSCALHSVLGAKLNPGAEICVIGAGTVGILTLAALQAMVPEVQVTSLARYSHQADLAQSFGASVTRRFEELRRSARTKSRTVMVGSRSSGGFDVTFDCVGSSDSIEQALEITKAGGTVILSGMPSQARIDLSPLWHKQINLRGTYAYGTEHHNGNTLRTFELALSTMDKLSLDRLVSVIYPLEDFEEAINHARGAGARGAVKIAFDPNAKSSRNARKVF